MNISLSKYEISIGKKLYTILWPNLQFQNLYVLSTDVKGAIILGDERSLENLSKLFQLAANHSDCIFFIRTSLNPITEYLLSRWSVKQKANDLILLHHSLQLKTRDWKQIRNTMLKTGNPIRNNSEVDKVIKADRNLSKFWYRNHKDFLDVTERFDSLFLVGSKDVFDNISMDAISVKDEGRDLFSRFPGFHAHEHIDFYARREYTKNYKYDGWSLCLDFCEKELWEIYVHYKDGSG